MALFSDKSRVKIRQRLGIEITKIQSRALRMVAFGGAEGKIEDESCFFLVGR